MTGKETTIALFGLPGLLAKGISAIIKELPGNIKTQAFTDMNFLNEALKTAEFTIIILDASILISSYKLVNLIKKENINTSLIAIQYQFINQALLNCCDKVITIDQTENEIVNIIELGQRKSPNDHNKRSESLSEREIEVLKLLVTGLSGKEIADKLNISVNTVITHRKNISQKTGIKSLAALTIYAVTNKVISMSNL